MTLWHLLTAISGCVPFAIAISEGYKAGFLGAVIGATFGTIMGLATIITVNKGGKWAFSRMSPYDENAISLKSEFLCGLIYLANLGFAIGSGCIATIAVKAINKLII